jgi:hypothetical protein
MAREGSDYEGKTSPWWYDPVQFHELLLAYGSSPLRSLIAQLDGCSGGKAGEIVSSAGLDRAICQSVSLDQVQPQTKRLQDKQPAMQGDAAGAFKKQIGRAPSETSQSAEAPLESEDGEGLLSGHR